MGTLGHQPRLRNIHTFCWSFGRSRSERATQSYSPTNYSKISGFLCRGGIEGRLHGMGSGCICWFSVCVCTWWKSYVSWHIVPISGDHICDLRPFPRTKNILPWNRRSKTAAHHNLQNAMWRPYSQWNLSQNTSQSDPKNPMAKWWQNVAAFGRPRISIFKTWKDRTAMKLLEQLITIPHVSHEKNKTALLSIESWLFHRNPYNGFLESPHNRVV